MEPLVTSIELCVEAVKALNELFSYDKKRKSDKTGIEFLLRSYYFETYYNKKVLETINYSQLNKDSLASIKAVAPLMKNDYGKTVIASIGALGEYIELVQGQSFLIDEEKIDRTNEELNPSQSIRQKIIFTTNRIEVLKNLAAMEDSRYLKKIKVSVRIKNIKRGIDYICEVFDQSLDNVFNMIYV